MAQKVLPNRVSF